MHKDSLIASLMGPTTLSTSETLLFDILNELDAIRYYSGGIAAGQFSSAKAWRDFVKNAPIPRERPSNQREAKPKQKPAMTPGNEVFPRLRAMMRRQMIRNS